MIERQLEYLARQLRSLRDGGLKYSSDDLFEAMDRASLFPLSDGMYAEANAVLESLQTIVRSPAPERRRSRHVRLHTEEKHRAMLVSEA